MPVLPILQLVGISSTKTATSFGLKVAGYARLCEFQGESPHAYEVPPAWAVPASAVEPLARTDLRRAFDQLTQGLTADAALMARGSSIKERPGESPTAFVRFDPRDREASFRRYEEEVHRVRGASDMMGVLLTVMVGGLRVFQDGTRALGWNNVSFVADTHHPMAPNDLHVSVVSGLGTRAVAQDQEVILITADRGRDAINSFVNKTEAAIRTPVRGSEPCLSRNDYRQKRADYFDFERGEIRSRLLEGDFFTSFRYDPSTGEPRSEYPHVVYGRLVGGLEELGFKDPRDLILSLEGLGQKLQNIAVGVNPFSNGRGLSHLIGVLQYLAERAGPVQVEGAFPSSEAVTPVLYQMTDTPEAIVSRIPLRVTRSHLFSNQVLGVAGFEGPLVWTRSATADVLGEIDRRFAATGYILFHVSHEGRIVEATPHCRVRLSSSLENLGSHAVALVRLKMKEDPEAGYLLAQNVKAASDVALAEVGLKADEEIRGVRIFKRVRLDSNGEEMAVEILS